MRKKILLSAIVAVVPLLAIAGFAAAGGGQSSLANIRDATAKYHDIGVARALHDEVELAQVQPFGDGTCIANLDGPGAMGIHLLLRDRVDGVLVPSEPEALLYEKRNDGSYKLTGVEYVVGGGPSRRSTGSRSSRRTSPASVTPARPSGRFTRGSGSPTATGCSSPGTRGSPATGELTAGGKRLKGEPRAPPESLGSTT